MMRLIKTYILRLYTNLELRDQICGDLRILPSRKAFPFKSNLELLDLVHQLTNEEAVDSPMRKTQAENESDLSVSEQPGT